MGNLHSIVQIKPNFHYEGAAITIKAEFSERFRKEYYEYNGKDYTELKEVEKGFWINNVNVDQNYYKISEKDLYLVIKSGGKWGYGENLIKLLNDFADYFEDTLFLIEDEHYVYIDKFEIKNGIFTYERLVESDGNMIASVEALTSDRDILYKLYLSKAKELIECTEFGDSYAQKGLKLLKKAVKTKPEEYKAHYLTGWAFNETGQYKEAIESLNKAAELRSSDIFNYIGEDKKYRIFEDDENEEAADAHKGIHTSIGYAYSRLGDYDSAIIHYDKSYNIIPVRNNYQPKINKSTMLIKQRKFDDAIKCCDEVIHMTSKKEFISEAFYGKACAYSMKKNPSEALHYLKTAVELNRENRHQAMDDEDFASLRDYTEFKKIVEAE